MKLPSWFTVALAGQLAAAVGFNVARGNRRVVAYLVVWSILAALVRAGHRRWPLPRPTLWALAAAGGVHLAGGLLPSPGSECRRPDLVRDVGGARPPQVRPGRPRLHLGRCHHRPVPPLDHVVDPDRGGPGARAKVAMLACWGFGAANELFEFPSLRFSDADVGGLANTGWDLAFNTLGSLLAAIWLATRPVSRPAPLARVQAGAGPA